MCYTWVAQVSLQFPSLVVPHDWCGDKLSLGLLCTCENGEDVFWGMGAVIVFSLLAGGGHRCQMTAIISPGQQWKQKMGLSCWQVGRLHASFNRGISAGHRTDTLVEQVSTVSCLPITHLHTPLIHQTISVELCILEVFPKISQTIIKFCFVYLLHKKPIA